MAERRWLPAGREANESNVLLSLEGDVYEVYQSTT